jgi:hypothetical protein
MPVLRAVSPEVPAMSGCPLDALPARAGAVGHVLLENGTVIAKSQCGRFAGWAFRGAVCRRHHQFKITPFGTFVANDVQVAGTGQLPGPAALN